MEESKRGLILDNIGFAIVEIDPKRIADIIADKYANNVDLSFLVIQLITFLLKA